MTMTCLKVFTLLLVSRLAYSDAPQIGAFSFPKELDAGMRASVQCAIIRGNPPFKFSWFKDEHKLTDARGVSIRKFDEFTSNLVIARVEADSNGNYTCQVSNSAGFDQKSAVLLIKGIQFLLRNRLKTKSAVFLSICKVKIANVKNSQQEK
ncbi:ig-like domain-containing protein [Trichonephila clavata]|uniref:Ig-like domain-containing protein n=1 Tax=Trichonephila clavata TaxID=2740835 RepID=A0A8X6G7Z6_TRICU|nr:ig-like domain-containing protein [Trichonephila clavata]